MVSRILTALASFGLVMLVIKTFTGTPASAEPGAFYPATGQESASISYARGSDGKSHSAFTGYDGPSKDQITYGVCEGDDCGTSAANWRKATIAMPGIMKVQLKLTADGRPRIFAIGRTAPNKSSYNRFYAYGECNSDCANAANWTFTEIAYSGDNLLSEVLALKVPDRTFALDSQDRPRFVYTDANYAIEPDHYGAFVLACEANCTDRANWTETDLAQHFGYNHEQFTKPVLATAPDGSLGVLTNVYALDGTGKKAKDGLYFYGCKSDCSNRANWSRAYVNETGGGSYPSPTWDLAFTNDSKPRIAQFAGNGLERQDLDHQLIYLWCDTDCTNEASWNGSAVGPGKGIGEGADLMLDAQNRPRIAMVTDRGVMALAACNEKCESNEPQWRSTIAEPLEAPQTERPQALPFHCDGEVWEALMPSISLNEESATIGYDIIVSARCLYKDFQEPIPSYTFHEIFHGTRVVTAKFPE